MKKSSFAFLLLFALPLLASDGVLVPVFFGGPGAFESVWRTRLTVYNNSDVPLDGIMFGWPCGYPCTFPIPAKASHVETAIDGTRYLNGFFLFPGVPQADVSYSLRVYDERRADGNYGTDIPVVPIDWFTDKPLQLLDVPTGASQRATLRVYAVPPVAPTVRVRVLQDVTPPPLPWPQFEPPRVLTEKTYALAVGTTPLKSYAVPSGAVIADPLNGIPANTSGSVRLEVQSATPGTPIWALVTVTNNNTQVVTAIVPRSSACATTTVFANESFYLGRSEPEQTWSGVVRKPCPAPSAGGRELCFALDSTALYAEGTARDIFDPFVGRTVTIRGKLVNIGYGSEIWPASVTACP